MWLELPVPDDTPVHRLSTEVLYHALFPEVHSVPQQQTQAAIDVALRNLVDAMNLIVHFMTAAFYGYMRTVNARRYQIGEEGYIQFLPAGPQSDHPDEE